MSKLKTPQNVLENRQSFFFLQWTSGFDECTQVLALHILHNQKELSVLLEIIPNRDDVGMLEESLILHFLIKPLAEIGVMAQGGGEAFDRKFSSNSLCMFGEIYSAHPALCKLGNYPVFIIENFADHIRLRCKQLL